MASFKADATQEIRCEIGDTLILENLALREGVADSDRAVVGNADDVTGVRLIGGFALLGKEEYRRIDRNESLLAHVEQFHAAPEMP